VLAFFRFVRALFSGRYSAVPWRSIAFAGVLLVYAFSPLDLIPDYLPGVGVIDNLALLGYFLRSVRKDVRKFVEWEKEQTGANATR
jgi:uncharacterized membrane protein YkvA (DUF1232 family)